MLAFPQVYPHQDSILYCLSFSTLLCFLSLCLFLKPSVYHFDLIICFSKTVTFFQGPSRLS